MELPFSLQGSVWRLGRSLPGALPLPAAPLQCVPPRLALGGSAHLDCGAVAYVQAWRGQSCMCSGGRATLGTAVTSVWGLVVSLKVVRASAELNDTAIRFC